MFTPEGEKGTLREFFGKRIERVRETAKAATERIAALAPEIRARIPQLRMKAETEQAPVVLAEIEKFDNLPETPVAAEISRPPIRPEQAELVRMAKETGDWVSAKDIPPISEGDVRIFRGVKSVAVESEFDKPLAAEEQEDLNALTRKVTTSDYSRLGEKERARLAELRGITNSGLRLSAQAEAEYSTLKAKVGSGYDQLSDGERARLATLQDRFWAGKAKPYAESADSAKTYAHDGVIYSLDATRPEVASWRGSNLTVTRDRHEIPYEVPPEVARSRARIFQVGKQAPDNVDLRPEVEEK